ncbi:MAG: HlyD family efflux transporter periplasmic adaptor subunit [Eubacteriales bacterium]|nr:HlyD family efflux transporter periplasmic adaptor subunit [Eubacteriales bacterium]
MDKLKKKPIIIYILVLIILYVFIYVIPSITGALVRTYTVEYGNLQVVDEAIGYFVRNEKVYIATSSGKPNMYIKQGTLIRKGTSVMEVTGSEEGEINDKYQHILSNNRGNYVSDYNYVSQAEGVVSYYADGYETLLTADNMSKMTLAKLDSVTEKNVLKLERNSCIKGEPVFKIIDNARWYLLCFVDTVNKDRYIVDDEITVSFPDDEIRAKVKDIIEQGSKTLIILETNRYYEKFDRLRVADVKLITSDTNGLIVENTSITKVGKQQGVYVKNTSNSYEFVPVSVITTDGKYSVVEKSFYYDSEGNTVTTISTYDEILKAPKDHLKLKKE